MEDNSVITPWEVSGEIDYDKLIERFGTTRLTPQLLDRIKGHTGRLHFMLRRGVFYSHRDLDKVLDSYEENGRFMLYTGRGPSGPVHLGHLVPWLFTKHLQDKFGSRLLFQFTDDERMLLREDMDDDITGHWVYQNALDLMALGFDPDKTEFIVNTRHIDKLYPIALKVARRVTCSTIKAVFGFREDTKPGIMFFPSIQSAPCFLESERAGEPVPCLIPAGIDQDPYWRISRDVAPKLGYPKPAQIHGRMLPGLMGDAKMSSSLPSTAIYLTDVPDLVEKKIQYVDTNGVPDSCPIFLYRYLLLEESDEEVNGVYESCKFRCISCEDCKRDLVKKVNRFLAGHQRRRELIKGSVLKMLE